MKLSVPVHDCTKMIPSRISVSTTGSLSRICSSLVESNTTMLPSPTDNCRSTPRLDTSMLRARPLGNSVTSTMPDCESVTTSVGAIDASASGTAIVRSAHAGAWPTTMGGTGSAISTVWPGCREPGIATARTVVGGLVVSGVVVAGESSTNDRSAVVDGGTSVSLSSRSSAPAEPTSSATTMKPATTLRPASDLAASGPGAGSSKSSGGGSCTAAPARAWPTPRGGCVLDPKMSSAGTPLSGTQSSRVHGDTSSGSSSATASFDHINAPVPSRRWTLVATSFAPTWRRSRQAIPMPSQGV